MAPSSDSKTILGQIGHTPLLKLNHVNETPDVDIYVKCEFLNPGGSIKDRMAVKMIEAAEACGKLRPGGTIVDQSTGNTGPALSFVGGVKGYDVHLFLPSQLGSAYDPADRIRIARLFGCRVESINLDELLPNSGDLNDLDRAAAFVAIRMKQCYDLQERDPAYWWANQLCNVDNTKAHREHTGKEILEQMNGEVDALVASIGTGGTILGIAEALKTSSPDLQVCGLVPTDDPRIEWVRSRAVHKALNNFGLPELRFIIEDILETDLLDNEITVKNKDAKDMSDRLIREEGLFCGMSSGANVWAALELAKTMKKGSRIVTVLVDRRDRYFAEYPNEHYVV